MNDVAVDLENITKSLQLFHFTGELNNAKKSVKINDSDIVNNSDMSDIKPEPDSDSNSSIANIRISKLETILKQVSTPAVNKQIGVKDLFSKIDNSVYKMPWRRLPEFHKNIKLKEYIKDKAYSNNDTEVLEKLLIGNAILNSEKCVTYDTTTMKITDIPALNYDEKTKEYKIVDINKNNKNKKIKK